MGRCQVGVAVFVRLRITVGIAAVGNFIGAVQPMHLVEGSNTDEFFVAAQWKQYKCWAKAVN